MNHRASIAATNNVIPGFCPLCRSRCGTLNTVRNGKLVSVEPDPSHPTGNAICRKGRAAPELLYNPHRLKTPLRRTAPKTAADPKWKPITWDEALEEIADRLRTIARDEGAERVAFASTTPAGTPVMDSIEWIERFIRLYGSPNICYATENCKWHQDFAHKFTFGSGIPTPDYANSNLIILWGYNPSHTWLSQATRIAEGRKRGARLLVIDPRRTGHAASADQWLRVRPGSDGVLALALARELIRGGKFDANFLRKWSNAPFLVREDDGRFLRPEDMKHSSNTTYMVWDGMPVPITLGTPHPPPSDRVALKGRFIIETNEGPINCRPAFEFYAEACERYSDAEIVSLTGLDIEEVRQAASLIASAGKVSYYAWTGVAQHDSASQTERAIALLYALTGCFDAPGGNVMFSKLSFNRVNDLTLLSPVARAKALGASERPLGPPSQGWVTASDLYTAILDQYPYPIRALVAFGGNILLSQADVDRGRKALETLEFHVHCEMIETPTCRYADILLPVNMPWEREALRIGYDVDADSEELVQLRPAFVEPLGETKADYEIVMELAKRLGMAVDFFGGDIQAGWAHMLQPLGITLDELRNKPAGVRIPLSHKHRKYQDEKNGVPRGLDTPTRRVEIYSEHLRNHHYPPVPTFDGPLAPGAPTIRDADFPLILTSAKNGFFCHTEHRNLPSLRRRSLEPIAEIALSRASALGLEDGSLVTIESRHGRALFAVRVNPYLADDVIVAEYGWWQSCPELGLPGFDPFSDTGSNLNRLISAERHDPLSGAVPLRSFACRLAVVKTTFARSWKEETTLVIADTRRETGNVTSFYLRRENGGDLAPFRPGQFLTIRMSPRMERCYSLSNDPNRVGREGYRISVKDEGGDPESSLSAYLNRVAQVGDQLQVRAPAGQFLLPTNPDFPVVLVAAGIGITPFMGLLNAVGSSKLNADIHLFYGNRNRETHAFQTELAKLVEQQPRLHLHDYYSRARSTPGVSCGRIDASVFDSGLLERRPRFYICGPSTMIAELRDGLERRDVLPFEMFHEHFSSPAIDNAENDGRFRIRFERSGAELEWTVESGSILDLAETNGVRLASGCRLGQCESCAVRVLSGSVRHMILNLETDDSSCLTCRAVPSSDLVLDA